MALFLVAPAGAASGRLDREVVLLRSPARVKAVLRERGNFGRWGFEIQISHAGQTSSVGTRFGGEYYPGAVRVLRKSVAWRQPYLFVVGNCGGATSWSCGTEHVFKIQGESFQKVGVFIVDELARAASSYKHGYFMDTYDKLEELVGLSHGGSPSFPVALRERDGHLTVDLKETWRMSREEVLDVLAEEPSLEEPCVECVGPFAKALAVALYCGKKDIADQIVAKTFTRQDLFTIDEVKKQVLPGELPAHWRGDPFGEVTFHGD
jgi:hypothetical protein